MTDAAPRAAARLLAGMAIITGPAISTAIGMTVAQSAAHRSPIGGTSDGRGRDVHRLAAGGPRSHRAGEADPADSGPAHRSARDSEGTITGVPALIDSTGFMGTRNIEGTATVGWDPGRHPLLVHALIAVDRSAESRRGGHISPGTTVRTTRRSMIGTGGSTGHRTIADVTVGRRGCLPEIRLGGARGQVPGREGGVPDSEDRARLAAGWAAAA